MEGCPCCHVLEPFPCYRELLFSCQSSGAVHKPSRFLWSLQKPPEFSTLLKCANTLHIVIIKQYTARSCFTPALVLLSLPLLLTIIIYFFFFRTGIWGLMVSHHWSPSWPIGSSGSKIRIIAQIWVHRRWEERLCTGLAVGGEWQQNESSTALFLMGHCCQE